MNDFTELPLFPLDLVLLPSRRLPLHIFEERYKEMINHCLENECEFGIVWGTDDNFQDTGCAALVTDVITRFPDGRLNIMIRGTRRFKVQDRVDIHSYISGRIEAFEDTQEATDIKLGEEVRENYIEALQLAQGWLGKQNENISLGELSFRIAANLNLPSAVQQNLLESNSVNERLQVVQKILDESLPTIREVKKRTGGNGHLA